MRIKLFSTLLSLLVAPLAMWGNVGPDGFHQFKKRIFVETGTAAGNGIQHALDAGFEVVYSIDIDPHWIKTSENRFAHNPNVKILLKNSSNELFDVIRNINESVTFWLDAGNGSPDPNAVGVKNTPLMDELEQIKHHPIKTHTILIDDLHCCETLLFDYLTLDQIITKVLEINPEYNFTFVDGGDDGEYEGNILVAYIEE